jgi:DNA-binding transcriptional MerR regulator
MRIGELAAAAGTSAKTLRFYEQTDLLRAWASLVRSWRSATTARTL